MLNDSTAKFGLANKTATFLDNILGYEPQRAKDKHRQDKGIVKMAKSQYEIWN